MNKALYNKFIVLLTSRLLQTNRMIMYKRRSVRRNNATNIYITTWVMKTYRNTEKLEEIQRKL
jgi:hypothetical protein